jgi:hypothetical protein
MRVKLIMLRLKIPKKKKKNDKQSFLSMSLYLREGEEFSFIHYQTQE